MSFDFDLFVSYRRDPDLALAREVERFLEGFHLTPVDEKVGALRPLAVCVDGQDFHLPPPDAAGAAEPGARDVHTVLERYLARCRELIVLCSRAAAEPSFVDDEVRWFVEHRGIEWIRLAFTEGEEPAASIDEYLPPSLRGLGIGTNIAYDLRGYDARRARSWRKVPPFQEELVRLACDLLGKPAGSVAPSFFRAELERVRTSSLQLASNARFESLLGDPARAMLRAVRAHELHPSEQTERALKDAYRTAILHHLNRRASSMITGSGPAYLAGRWKQGDVFVETSPDGRWRALVTERGRDGGSPPGDVYLISNETLRALKLDPPSGAGGRVEDVAFDRTSRRLFVARYFHVIVYGLDGRVLGTATFQRWTKSPVPLVDGYVLDRFIVGADSKGGLWLVDPDDYKAGVELRSEWSRDAVIAVDISPDGTTLAIVLESTKAELIELTAGEKPRVTELAARGALCVRFLAADSLVTAGEDGRVRLFERLDGTWRESPPGDVLPSQIEWVAPSDDGTLLAAVGTDRRMFVLDARTGALRDTLDYAHEIDWRAQMLVPFARSRAWPADPVADGETIAWPNDALPVLRLIECGGELWALSREESGEAVHRRCYRVVDGSARVVDNGVVAVTQHGPVTFLHSEFQSGGRALWRDAEGLLRGVPRGAPSVHAVFEDAGEVWIATSKGAYILREGQFELGTPEDWDVRDVRRAGGRLWLRTNNGVFIADEAELVRVTEPFVDIATIVEAGGSVWLVRSSSWLDSNGGPAIRVDGWIARELPHRAAVVGAVLDVDGVAWIVEEKCVHRVDGDDLRRVDGLETFVDAAVAAGTTIWATTHGRGPLALAGPSYRIERGAGRARATEWTFGRLLSTRGGAYATFYANGASRCARLEEDGADEIDLGGALLSGSRVIDDQLWLTTSRGAMRVEGRDARRVGPDRPVQSVQSVGNAVWLLGQDFVVRIDAAGEQLYTTEGLIPSRIVDVGGEQWVLTATSSSSFGWPFTVDDGASDAGPALRVGRKKLRRVAPDGVAVRDVVRTRSGTWMLTSVGGRIGPARRWKPRASTDMAVTYPDHHVR